MTAPEAGPLEAARNAILANVPQGYGMTTAEAEVYARAAIAAYLRATAKAESLVTLTDREEFLLRLAAELDPAPAERIGELERLEP